MSKDVFANLPEHKREKVLAVLKETFQAKAFQQVTVKEIVEKLGIARGSFYQYFDNLEDAYFTILDREMVDIHVLFLKIVEEEEYDLFSALEKYGEALGQILFEPEGYSIYANCFLYWDDTLHQNWSQRHSHQQKIFAGKEDGLIDREKIQFIKLIVHGLIQRNYKEQWNKERFLQIYRQYIDWIQKGVN